MELTVWGLGRSKHCQNEANSVADDKHRTRQSTLPGSPLMTSAGRVSVTEHCQMGGRDEILKTCLRQNQCSVYSCHKCFAHTRT